MSVEELVRRRVLGSPASNGSAGDGAFDFESELDALTVSVTPLPAEFSRADISPDEY